MCCSFPIDLKSYPPPFNLDVSHSHHLKKPFPYHSTLCIIQFPSTRETHPLPLNSGCYTIPSTQEAHILPLNSEWHHPINSKAHILPFNSEWHTTPSTQKPIPYYSTLNAIRFLSSHKTHPLQTFLFLMLIKVNKDLSRSTLSLYKMRSLRHIESYCWSFHAYNIFTSLISPYVSRW